MKAEIISAAQAKINALEAERKALIAIAQRAVYRSRGLRAMIRMAKMNPTGGTK